MQADLVRLVKGPTSQKAFGQLEGLQTELSETGVAFACLPGQHDDLGISCCMLYWAARHPHLRFWMTDAFAERMPRPPQPKFKWGAACT